MCDNKNSVVTSCTLDYVYFGIITETEGFSGREDRETDKSQMKRIWSECASTTKTDFKEKTGLVPWCQSESPVEVTCILTLIVVLRAFYHRVACYLYYPED